MKQAERVDWLRTFNSQEASTLGLDIDARRDRRCVQLSKVRKSLVGFSHAMNVLAFGCSSTFFAVGQSDFVT